VNKLLQEWCAGAVGYIPSEKPEDCIRGYGENVNSLRWFDKKYNKTPKLLRQISHFNPDLLQLLETQTNFDSDQWTPRDGKLMDKIGVGTQRKAIAASNMHCRDRCCAGGTAQMTFGPLSSFILSQGADTTGLGRWVWTLVGMEGGKKTRFITAYQPCENGGGETVFTQHRHYFEGLGNHTNPRTLFCEHLLELIAECKSQGEEVVLYIDANENVYTGRLAKALSTDDFNMKEQYFTVTGKQAPPSHSTGHRPITGLFATAGVRFRNIFQSAHHSGLGDDRFTVYDVEALSVVGSPLRHAKQPANRLLRMEVERNVRRFNKVMEQLVDHHRMFKKLGEIYTLSDIAQRRLSNVPSISGMCN
jgi:hypothetical protein